MSNEAKERPADSDDQQRSDAQCAHTAASTGKTSQSLAQEKLTIYDARLGEEGSYWTPDHDAVEIPEGWEYLPCGNAFLTRRVKKGPHWILKGRYNRKGGYRPTHGIYAPAEAIQDAQTVAAATAGKRGQERQKSKCRRDKAEEEYQQKFREACLAFLDFTPTHRQIAEEIAEHVSVWACKKHSGRVGRTGLLSLESKVSFAVRAYIRHTCTNYESNLSGFWAQCPDDVYRDVKAQANAEADRFLTKHRGDD